MSKSNGKKMMHAFANTKTPLEYLPCEKKGGGADVQSSNWKPWLITKNNNCEMHFSVCICCKNEFTFQEWAGNSLLPFPFPGNMKGSVVWIDLFQKTWAVKPQKTKNIREYQSGRGRGGGRRCSSRQTRQTQTNQDSATTTRRCMVFSARLRANGSSDESTGQRQDLCSSIAASSSTTIIIHRLHFSANKSPTQQP